MKFLLNSCFHTKTSCRWLVNLFAHPLLSLVVVGMVKKLSLRNSNSFAMLIIVQLNPAKTDVNGAMNLIGLSDRFLLFHLLPI